MEVEVCQLAELPPGTHRVLEHAGPEGVGVYNCAGALLRDRGSLHPRRRQAVRGRVGARRLRGHLPAARRALRRQDGRGPHAAGLHPGRHLPRPRPRRRHGRRRDPLTADARRPRQSSSRPSRARGGGCREGGSPLVERSLAVGAEAGALLYALAAAIPGVPGARGRILARVLDAVDRRGRASARRSG